MLWRHLIGQLLCKWWVTSADHSLLSVLYIYNSLFNRCVTPRMDNSSVMQPTKWLPPFFRTFCDQNSNFRLLGLWASEHLSTFFICSRHLVITESLTHEEQLPADFFKSNAWKLTLKDLKICSGKGKKILESLLSNVKLVTLSLYVKKQIYKTLSPSRKGRGNGERAVYKRGEWWYCELKFRKILENLNYFFKL
jgi:hypothetical protein